MNASFSFVTQLKKALCICLAASLMSVPAYAQTQQTMITTGAVLAQIDRAEAQRQVEAIVANADIQKALIDRGLMPDEVKARLASLTEKEIRDLAGQLDQARAGGEITGILVAVLLVVLIIFLIKRI